LIPAFPQASASSLSGSRLNGVAATMLKGSDVESNIANPSWCFAVMTMYFMPACFASATQASASNFVGLNCAGSLW
jgi:hypothetical protein